MANLRVGGTITSTGGGSKPYLIDINDMGNSSESFIQTSENNGYIKYNNGLLICWGIKPKAKNKYVSFPAVYKTGTVPVILLSINWTTTSYGPAYSKTTNTNFYIEMADSGRTVSWTSIGYWK